MSWQGLSSGSMTGGGGKYLSACHLMKVMKCLSEEEDTIKTSRKSDLICKEAKIRH